MALIKCEDCGKEFSDKASACPNCGCPYKNKKTEEEKEIIKSVINTKKVKSFENIWTICIVIGLLMSTISFIVMALNWYNKALPTTALICFLMFTFYSFNANKYFNNISKSYIILTNKRVYGKTYTFFSTINIDIAIDKISSIHSITSTTEKMNTLEIESIGSTKYSVKYVSNDEEFIKEFQKIK